MDRILLYYPSMLIPDGQWLRTALLYWDGVASIVPAGWRRDNKLTPDLQYLKAEGQYSALMPTVSTREVLETLRDVLSDSSVRASINEPKTYELHRDKLSRTLVSRLRHEGLLEGTDANWFRVAPTFGMAYMGALAMHVAERQEHHVVPSTDDPSHEELVYCRGQGPPTHPCARLQWIRALPTPRHDASLADILAFKRRNRDSLLRFRSVMQRVHASAVSAETPDALRDVLASAAEEVTSGARDLSEDLADSRIEVAASTVSSLVSLKSPAVWTAAGAYGAHLSKLADVSIGWTLAGIAITGALQVGTGLVQARTERRARLRDSPFAYVHHAHREGLTGSLTA